MKRVRLAVLFASIALALLTCAGAMYIAGFVAGYYSYQAPLSTIPPPTTTEPCRETFPHRKSLRTEDFLALCKHQPYYQS